MQPDAFEVVPHLDEITVERTNAFVTLCQDDGEVVAKIHIHADHVPLLIKALHGVIVPPRKAVC